MAKNTVNDLQNVDKRLTERLAARGDFSAEEMSSALQKLPDLEGEAENIADRVYGPIGTDTSRE